MNIKSTLLALSLCISATAFADGIAAVKAFNDKTQSFAGDFTQTVKNAKKTTTSQGTFAVLRPGFFKWTYQKPDEQLIVGDGNSVWLYDKELAQVTQRKQQAVLGASPAAILADKAALENNFTLKNDGEKNGVSYVLALPKTPDNEYKQIRLGFNDDNTLKEMQ
ncbi:MAG: outer membrane lipoprotein chaperone LolA, partial [Neisseriaceae bacterium]|nr:outer membrane lipoprotein chaperone LolA [Neisseriaceae bacterium]